jgi:hypothetical protein
LRRLSIYSMMGIIATQVAPTTRNASVNTCTTLCRPKHTQLSLHTP